MISVGCKKKELVGDVANSGREWQPAGYPEPVRVHGFLDQPLGTRGMACQLPCSR